MGGQSFKCPHCAKWFLTRGQVRDHLVGHGEIPGTFTVEGVGSHTRIERNRVGTPDHTTAMSVALLAAALTIPSTESPAATPDPSPDPGGGDFGGGGSSGEF